jgi:DNA-binding transcriptional LysR family regulator
MATDPGIPTLDQLRVFLAVVDVGSFAGAARQLGRATSVISYSIGNLELRLDLALPPSVRVGITLVSIQINMLV